MSRIQRLSPNLINKIAAGEVIERPGSVVKELMENSIDAGASRIDVVIEKGGSELIRIADNGCGMDGSDLILAVTSHATSKLRGEEDLFNVSSMGFRGEAMASVAEISQMTVRSRVNPEVKPAVGDAFSPASSEEICGYELRVEGGAYENPMPCGCPPGTQIDVKNLFFNTPVRRKFLKSTQTEFGYISEFFSRLALANPQIHFTLRHNSRVVYDLPATSDWLQRICDVEGKDLADALLYIEKTCGRVRIFGYAARPNFSRSNPKMQFLFLNGRPIRDRALQHALLEAYRGLLTQNRFPICFLKLEMPPDMVDVNVHPTKMEVRFQDSNEIYGQFLAALRSKFLTTNMATYIGGKSERDTVLQSLTETFRNIDAPEIQDETGNPKETDFQDETEVQNTSGIQGVTGAQNTSGIQNTAEFQVPAGISRSERTETAAFSGENAYRTADSSASLYGNEDVPPFRPFETRSETLRANPFSTRRSSVSSTSSVSGTSGVSGTSSVSGASDRGSGKSSERIPGSTRNSPLAEGRSVFPEENSGAFQDGFTPGNAGENPEYSLLSRNIIQVHDRYIVTECEEGLMVVDQHAMHERILYERLKNRMKSMSVEVQRLLVPEAVDLRPSEASMLLERREQLEEMGIQLESFGGNTVLVHAVPAMLYTFEKKDRLRIDELLYEILETIRSGGGELSLEKFLDDTLHTIACKAACKAGQHLSYDEMRKLLDAYRECPAADHCPHGRPSVLIWSCTELDKLFCRIL